jgi:hypothetical protein
MKTPGIERRRTPRVQLIDGHRLSLNASIPVRVLDISRSGVSIGSKTELSVGDRGALRATVGAESLSVVIEVKHVSIDTKGRGGIRYRAGATFVSRSAEQQLLLEQVLGEEEVT